MTRAQMHKHVHRAAALELGYQTLSGQYPLRHGLSRRVSGATGPSRWVRRSESWPLHA